MRRWRIELHFRNGATYLSSVTLKDIAAFIKEETIKNKGVKKRKTLPVNAWLLDMALEKADKSYYSIDTLIRATIG